MRKGSSVDILRRRYSILPILLLVAAAACAACGATMSRASKKHAKPWDPKLAPVFDDSSDPCTPWMTSDEPWAIKERELLTQRGMKADIIAVGQVQDVEDTRFGSTTRQTTLSFLVSRILRGKESDLPGGQTTVLLSASRLEDAGALKRIMGKASLLFLRWLPGDKPPFHWHVACLSEGVLEYTKNVLRKRDEEEGVGPPRRKR